MPQTFLDWLNSQPEPDRERLLAILQQHLSTSTATDEAVLLQRMNPNSPWQFDPLPFMDAIRELLIKTCFIRTPGACGSGFLVAPDIVMTNYHVIEDLLEKSSTAKDASETYVIFDHQAEYDEKHGKPSIRRLHESNWLIAHSPYAQDEGTPAARYSPTENELDFALLRLSTAAGKDYVRRSTGELRQRGWCELASIENSFPSQSMAVILHHPGETREPGTQRVSFGHFIPNAPEHRLWYNANTAPGSSGGLVACACGERDLRIVGLHHAGRTNANQGVPLHSIRSFLGGTRPPIFEDGKLVLDPPQRKCAVVISGADNNIQRRKLLSELIEPAIKRAAFLPDILSATSVTVLDPAFSPLRTAAAAIVVVQNSSDYYALVAAGFRLSQGLPLVVVRHATPLLDELLRNHFRGKDNVRLVTLPNLADVQEFVEALGESIELAFAAGSIGSRRVVPWTLIEVSMVDKSEVYLDANDEAAEVLLGPGATAQQLIGRPGRAITESVTTRLVTEQAEAFEQEQGRLYSLLLEQDNVAHGALLGQELKSASVPMVFEDGGHRKAFLPVWSRYSSLQAEQKLLLEIVHLDVTKTLNRAFDGHWQISPTCGLDSLHQFDQLEQLRTFLPIGIVRVDRHGVVQEINRAAELLLDVARNRAIGHSLHSIVGRIQFHGPGSDDDLTQWYCWDTWTTEARTLPPLKVHEFSRESDRLRGCCLGLRDLVGNRAAGCYWVFALTETQQQGEFVKRLREYGEREWLWECYAASYDKVLLACDYYRETRERHCNELRRAMKSKPNFRLLDVGAGTGNVSIELLRENGQMTVEAVDSSRAMMRVFDRKCSEYSINDARCARHVMRAEEMREFVNGTWDAVNMMMALFDMDDHRSVLEFAARKLATGGVMVITDPLVNFDVQKIIDGARRQLEDSGKMDRLKEDWNIVAESGRALAKMIRKRTEKSVWNGVEGVESWLTSNGFSVTSSDCYFDQCKTLVARKGH